MIKFSISSKWNSRQNLCLYDVSEIQCQEIAYSIGKKLKIPTINIDLCIVEALCTLECSAKTLIMNALNECYEMFRKRTTDHFADNENDAANDG